MSNQELSYEDYTKTSLAVRGNRNKFNDILKQVNARWNPRMKNGAGWLVSKEHLSILKEIITAHTNIKSNTPDLTDLRNIINVKSRKT